MILIAGESGQLGQELIRLFILEGVKYTAPKLSEWDITDKNSTRQIVTKVNPTIIINCAAYTAVDKAEAEQELAYTINRDAAGFLAEVARETDTFLLQISTDFVFSSLMCENSGEKEIQLFKPNDPTHPQSVYAASKDAGDKEIIRIASSSGDTLMGASIIRTSWLYSKFGNNFVKTIVKLASDDSREYLRVIEDQIGRPTWAKRLADFILEYIRYMKILDTPANRVEGGIFHFSNSGIASWYDFAVEIVKIAQETSQILKKMPIIPINSEEYPLPAKRPHFSVMDLKETRFIMPHIPHWKDDLREYFRDLTGK